MPPKLDAAAFVELERLHSLIEDNDLALIEANADLKILQEGLDLFSQTLELLSRRSDFAERFENLPEALKHKGALEMQILAERRKRLGLFAKAKEFAEGFGIWREPTEHSESTR